jgi:hypothetical protein
MFIRKITSSSLRLGGDSLRQAVRESAYGLFAEHTTKKPQQAEHDEIYSKFAGFVTRRKLLKSERAIILATDSSSAG